MWKNKSVTRQTQNRTCKNGFSKIESLFKTYFQLLFWKTFAVWIGDPLYVKLLLSLYSISSKL